MSFLFPTRFRNKFSTRRKPIHNALAMGHRRLVAAPNRTRHRSGIPAVDALALVVGGIAAFWPVVRNGFVNWDDPAVLVSNPQLAGEHVFSWAFTTTWMGHYQPAAWVAWWATIQTFGVSASALHAISLAGHLVNGLLVYLLGRRLLNAGGRIGEGWRAGALAAAAVFLLHPVQTEAVAWASAAPYVFSLTLLLLATIAYIGERRSLAVALYAVSLLTRNTAPAFPLLLLILDLYPLARQTTAPLGELLVEKVPFALLAVAAGVREWRARDVASLQDVSLGARATLAATAPFAYVARILAPFRLTPLDPLPIAAAVRLAPLFGAAIGLVGVTAIAWRYRREAPLVAAAWIAFIVSIAPVAGLTPSGLQATADRYLYVPMVIVSLVIGAGVARLAATASLAIAGTMMATVLAALGALTWQQARYWHDSIALWSRAAELDPRNDVATYNLALAFAEVGREDEAADAYRRTLALVPDHDLARHNLAALDASRAEREADRLAKAGHAEEAGDEYARALALDANRPHAHAARGMLLAGSGRFDEAAAELELALQGGVTDVEVPNTLAFALRQTGNDARAAAVLTRASIDHAADLNVEHNLARLLATSQDPRVRDGSRAVTLALDVCNRTHNDDPRALDTLAAAYAAAGQRDLARSTAARAAARARELGDEAMADAIAHHAAAMGLGR